MLIITLIVAAAAGYGVAVKWGRGIPPVIAAVVGAIIALLVSLAFGAVGLGGVFALIVSPAAAAGVVYAIRSREFGSPTKTKVSFASSSSHQPAPSRPASGGGSGASAPAPALPEPEHYSSDEEAGAAMNAVGDLQRRFESGTMSNEQVAAMGEEISRKCQGIMNYFVSQGREINLYNTVVDPICGWAISQLAPIWIMDQGAAPHSAAAKRAYYDITALMKKYEHLKPA